MVTIELNIDHYQYEEDLKDFFHNLAPEKYDEIHIKSNKINFQEHHFLKLWYLREIICLALMGKYRDSSQQDEKRTKIFKDVYNKGSIHELKVYLKRNLGLKSLFSNLRKMIGNSGEIGIKWLRKVLNKP